MNTKSTEVTKRRPRGLVPLFNVLTLLLMAACGEPPEADAPETTSSALAAESAGAVTRISSEAAPSATAGTAAICHDARYGGSYYCGYGKQYAYFSTGTEQLFVIGTDFSVWTRWTNPNGSISNWVNLGGKIRRSYSSYDFNVDFVKNGNLWVMVVGTDNAWWYKIRYAGSGTWSGWRRWSGE